MIQIVTAENRHLFYHALTAMHRQRKQVFIDEMRWPLDEIAGIEIDRFDSEQATYLIETENAGSADCEVTGSVRLLRTDRPHLLGDVFPDLCTGDLPRGDGVWEATRFCPVPDMPPGAPRHAMLMRMIAAIMETALLFDIKRVTFVASKALAPLASNAGWRVEPLGASRRVGRDRLQAFVADITEQGLGEVRTRNGFTGLLTELASRPKTQAA